MAAPAGWYPDPDGSGGQRYFDGADWTEHRAPAQTGWAAPPGPYPGSAYWGPPPWKGAQLGRPAAGPGSLASPGRRLGARALDALVLLPVMGAVVATSVAIVAPHAGPIFPTHQSQNANAQPTPGFVWIYLAVIGAVFITGLIGVIYETVLTARFGRTLGKRWLRIRPVRLEGGGPVGAGRALGRASIYWLSTFLGWLGALDPLWCLWDANQQCVHDKVANTVVVND